MTLEHPYTALVIGSGGAIGSALAAALEADILCTRVVRVSRATMPDFDLCQPDSIAQAAQRVAPQGPFDLILDATGALVIDGVGPEKSLAALDATALTRSFQINTIGPALVLKQFSPLLAPGRAVYAKLSARVGSIADNRKGGWYGYRASKAALNMVLQTAAIEMQRRHPERLVVALQPGTVRSPLSAPFVAGGPGVLEPAQAAAALLAAIRTLSPQAGAQFIDHRGQSIPW